MNKKQKYLCIVLSIIVIVSIIVIYSMANKKEKTIDKPIKNILEAYEYVKQFYEDKGEQIEELLTFSEILPIQALEMEKDPMAYRFLL